jgi:hypothetical protein
MKYISYLLLGLLVFTSSCRKDSQFVKKAKQVVLPAEIRSLWTAAEDVLYELSLPVDGYIMIGNNTTHHNQTSIPGEHIYVDGFILNSSGVASDFGSFSIDSTDYITPSQVNGHYGYKLLPGTEDLSYLFGNTNSYSLAGNTGSGFPGFVNESLYFPEAIMISSPSYIGGQIDTTEVNDNITWNADSYDSIGVSIVLSYDPIKNVANGLVSNNPDPIIKYYHVLDNGSFQLSSTVLSNFPAGAKLDVHLARGNYKRVTATGTLTYYIGILNYTKISTIIQIEE